MTALDPNWFSDCQMERLVVHWTAGSYTISDFDKRHYHFLVDKNGVGVRGNNPVSGNARSNPVGAVTSHVRNFNTGSIGITVAAMGDAIEHPFSAGPWPITPPQWIGLLQAVAQLADFYAIPVNRDCVLMHGEVQQQHGVAQLGKWDIGRLPFNLTPKNSREVGDLMRAEVLEIIEDWAAPPDPEDEEQAVTITIEAPPGVKIVVKQVES